MASNAAPLPGSTQLVVPPYDPAADRVAQQRSQVDPQPFAGRKERPLCFRPHVHAEELSPGRDDVLNQVSAQGRDRFEHPLQCAEGEHRPEWIRRHARGRGEERRNRSCLQQVEAAVSQGPLDVLRSIIIQGGDLRAERNQRPNLRIGQRRLSCRSFRYCQYPAAGPAAHAEHLGAERSADDLAGGYFHHVMIRLYLAGDERLAQPHGRVDDGLRAQPRKRVGREQHAGRLAFDHLLHHHRQRAVPVRHPVALTVADGARRPQAAPARDDRRRATRQRRSR